jgi:metal-responsive CopG/Arc/MetJ family transcriptional regulator
MIRMKINLDEETYRELKRRVGESNQSMSAVVRKALKETMSTKPGIKKRRKLSDFSFIGSVIADEPTNTVVEHDEVQEEKEW